MLARAMEPLIAAFHRFGEAKGMLRKGLYTRLQYSCRAIIVREALEGDDWRLPTLFTSADVVATKAVGPLMRVMDLYLPHMDEGNDPPRPSVAFIRTPSVATKALIALLLCARS